MITKNQVAIDNPLKLQAGKRFKILRELEKMSQQEWAAFLEINQEKVSRIERSGEIDDDKVLTKLAVKKDVSLEWLFTGKGPKYKGIEKNSLMTDVNLMREEIAVLRAIVKKQEMLIDDMYSRFYGKNSDNASIKPVSKQDKNLVFNDR